MNRRRVSVVSAQPGNDPNLRLAEARFDRVCLQFQEFNDLIKRATELLRDSNANAEGFNMLAEYIRAYAAIVTRTMSDETGST